MLQLKKKTANKYMYGNINLAIMPIMPILCSYEKPEWWFTKKLKENSATKRKHFLIPLQVCTTNYSNFYYRTQTKFAKVMFSQVSVCPQGRGHAWRGDLHGRGMYVPRIPGCHACLPCHTRPPNLWHAVNERAVRILLEWILVIYLSISGSQSESFSDGNVRNYEKMWKCDRNDWGLF